MFVLEPCEKNSSVNVRFVIFVTAFRARKLLGPFEKRASGPTSDQSRASAVLQSNPMAIKLGTAEARRLNWAYAILTIIKTVLKRDSTDHRVPKQTCGTFTQRVDPKYCVPLPHA